MRRVLVFVLLVAVVLVASFVLLSRRTPEPAPVETAAAPPAASTPSAPGPAAPTPEAKTPVETPRPAPRARPAAPDKPAPAPEPAPVGADATLQIDVDVPDAQVFVDRVFLGKAPLMTTDVKPGSHRLNVSATGYEGVSQSLEVKPGLQQVSIRLREVRLDASVDVVHKHRMGSCTGRLVATPQGMRYETSDKGDTFSSGLLDLDAFEVDYLKKNLHIKLKGGKSYDFTDPEGNADRLFVFHRDVDKARERLRKGDPPAQP